MNLGPAVNSSANEWSPMISTDHTSLHFISDRPGTTPNNQFIPDFVASTDIYQTSVKDVSQGDFNGDGLLNLPDMDLLTGETASGNNSAPFDLTGDGTVNIDDVTSWLGSYDTLSGDADLNRSVEFGDFLALSSNFDQPGTWSNGDFDGSGVVTFADFTLLASSFGQPVAAVTAGAASVPEPSGVVMLLLGLVGLLRLGGHRSF